MIGQRAPHDIWVHIGGIDIVRVDDQQFYVLEDNARTPVRRLLHAGKPRSDDAADAGSVRRHQVAPVDDYPDELLATLALGRAAAGRRARRRSSC